MNSNPKERVIPGDEELLIALLNDENCGKLVIENGLRKWVVNYGDKEDRCESEKVDRCLITGTKPRKRKIAYDNRNYLKSMLNVPLGCHQLTSTRGEAKWTIDQDNRNYMKSCVNDHLGKHRHSPLTKVKWEVGHDNRNFIKKFVNNHRGMHKDAPAKREQWSVIHDNKSYITSFVNKHEGMHRIAPEKVEQWSVNCDNRNFISHLVNDHKGIHRHAEEPERAWDIHPNNQSYIRSFMNDHRGEYRVAPKITEKWHINQNNQNYLKSRVNEPKGFHRIAEDTQSRWQVDPDNRNFISQFVNDHIGNHRHGSEPKLLWDVGHNNKNFIMSQVNDHKGMHRVASCPEEKWAVTHDNKNFIRSKVNKHQGLHRQRRSKGWEKWQIAYDNVNYIKSNVHEDKGLHTDVSTPKRDWTIDYDNKIFVKSSINEHAGQHRHAPCEERMWKVDYGNKNYIRSQIHSHRNMHQNVPETHHQWEIKPDNKNYIRSHLNDYNTGAYQRMPDTFAQWEIPPDNKNYIRSHVNEERGLHRIPSDLMDISVDDKTVSHSDTHRIRFGEGKPDLFELKYDTRINILKAADTAKGEVKKSKAGYLEKDSTGTHSGPTEEEAGVSQRRGGYTGMQRGIQGRQRGYTGMRRGNRGRQRGYIGKRWEVPDSNQNYVSTLPRTPDPPAWFPSREIRIQPHEIKHTNEYQFGLGFEQEDVPYRPELRKMSQGGFRFHDVVRNYFDFDNDWVDEHPDNYTEDSTHYSEIEESTPPESQQFYGTAFKQDDVPHTTELRRTSQAGFRFLGTVRSSFDYEDRPDWMMDTSQHPGYQIKTKSKEFLKPGTVRAHFDTHEGDLEEEEEEDQVEYESGVSFPQVDVPHMPLLRKMSQGGFRFHGVVRNIYDYDIAEDDLAKYVQLHPGFTRNPKSKDYQKPGTTRPKFDVEELEKEPEVVEEPESKDVEESVPEEPESKDVEESVPEEPEKKVPDVSRNAQETFVYFQDKAGKNVPSKWQKVGPQPTTANVPPDASKQGGVADALSFFHEKVAPRPEENEPGIADTLAFLHQKVAPKRSAEDSVAQPEKKEFSSRVQDTLLQYQQGTSSKSRPATRMEHRAHRRDELSAASSDTSMKQITMTDSRPKDADFVTFNFIEDRDDHRSHPKDYGTKQHSRLEKFSKEEGRKWYIKSEEKYAEIYHPGAG